jgi:hypothetical protein
LGQQQVSILALPALATHHYYRGGEFERSGEHWFETANIHGIVDSVRAGQINEWF